MEYISKIGKLDSAVWNMHLTVPDEISKHFLRSTGNRVICEIDGRHTFHAALMPQGNGRYFININQEIRKLLRLSENDHVPVKLEADTSKYGIFLPEEMEELLHQDEEGSHFFHSLTMGKQRGLLHICGKPKTSEVRLRKSLMILDYLKSVGGQLDYRELNQYFKDFRSNYT